MKASSCFEIDDASLYRRVCGYMDRNLKTIESEMEVRIIPRGNTLIVSGSSKASGAAIRLLHVISDYLHENGTKKELDDFDVRYLARSFARGKEIKASDINRFKIVISETGRVVVPRTTNQADYISLIHEYPITFAIGPAGTGKTYLAVAVGLHMLFRGKVERIVLSRPAVEAGENLGFLPGDLIQKINPYLRPLYDALFDLLSFERVSSLIEKGIIEIAPLAYMRGRTLNRAYIILDEAQNTTTSQMKMFLTRLGNDAKIVISGDVTQIDLDKTSKSGLLQALEVLRDVKEIAFMEFTTEDICRHPVVEKIVAAYNKYEAKCE
ncbi:MAG: PhoH family protein [Spirochaetes bacterium]|nr:PhoH family protein [Spirochaetota bacterium]